MVKSAGVPSRGLSLLLKRRQANRLGPVARLGSWPVGIKPGRPTGFTGPGAEAVSEALRGSIGVMKTEAQPRLGPVVAILTVRQGRSMVRPFGDQTSMLKGFFEAGQQMGTLVYVLTPQGIDANGHVSGWYPSRGRWKLGHFPYPDVVYDRIPTRRAERLAAVRSVKSDWQQRRDCIYFGVDFFDKWQVHLAWSNGEASRYIPDTLLYKGVDTLLTMLGRHKVVYIKPCSSSLGLGVARIEGGQQGPWMISWRQPDGSRHDDKFNTALELRHAVDAIAMGRRYLVQQGINMTTYQDRLFDIRVNVQRDGLGRWDLTAIGARVGAAESIVTNMAAGARAHPIQPIVDEVARNLGKSPQRIHNQLKDVAMRAADVLGRSYGPRLGELGLDLAIDREGEVWVLEANSKPMRTVFQNLGDPRVARLCLERPMEYARYLAGFHPDAEILTGLGKRGESID